MIMGLQLLGYFNHTFLAFFLFDIYKWNATQEPGHYHQRDPYLRARVSVAAVAALYLALLLALTVHMLSLIHI